MPKTFFRLSEAQISDFAKTLAQNPEKAAQVLALALKACSELVDDINCTGGLVPGESIFLVPAADPSWSALANTTQNASLALATAGINEAVKIEQPDPDSDKSSKGFSDIPVFLQLPK